MLILHILTSYEAGRAENYAASVIGDLHQAGIRQCVVFPEAATYGARLQKTGVEMAPQILRAGRWRQHFLLGRLIKRLRPDVIHCWTRAAGRLAPERIPAIGWLAGYDDPDLFSGCTNFVGVTADITAHLRRCGVPQSCVHSVPVFSGVSATPPLDRGFLATPREAKVLLNLSPLHPASRLDALLKALGNLPGCYLWLAGNGPLRRDIERQAVDAGLADRVRFAGDRLDRGALLRAADLCVLAARDEPLGTIVQDSWAAGTPLVAVAEAGSAVPIANDADGLVTDGSPPALAQAIRRILEEDDLRRRLIAQGYASGLGAYAREAVIRQWIELYKEVLATRC